MQFPPIEKILLNVVADSAKTGVKISGIYPLIVQKSIEKGWVPNSMVGQLVVFVAMSSLSEIAKTNLSQNTLLGNTLRSMVGDITSEVTANILQLQKNPEFAALVTELARKEVVPS